MRETKEELRGKCFRRLIEILEKGREITMSLFQDSLMQTTQSAVAERVEDRNREKTVKTKIKG